MYKLKYVHNVKEGDGAAERGWGMEKYMTASVVDVVMPKKKKRGVGYKENDSGSGEGGGCTGEDYDEN
jgi:hypothetical protein